MSTAVSSRPRSSSVNSRPTSRSTNYRASQVSKQPAGRNANIPNDGKRQIVGQYMLGKTIGEGTFGKVKLAVHMPSGEKVAIKILEKSRIKESADVRRVNREIKILKKARHSNIIQLYEVLDTPNAIYLIMECAEGGEMFDFIVAQKHVPEVQACKFFHQIVDGVENLHMNEITHRDLKPENLLLKASPDGWIVKVVDFGLSNTHEGNRLLSTACGSPCYAAPEMIAGKKYVGPMADIWSMGVILFALVCGYLPFEDANTAILYKKILSGDYKPPKWISPEVKDLIRCILEVDPRKRFTMSDIRKHPWYQMVSEANIPREIIDEREEEITRNETLKILSTSGIDIQQLLDGLASHACNSLTATYYLFEQKHRTVRAKQAQNAPPPSNNAPHHYQSDNQITNNPHHSNVPGAVNNNNNNNNDHQPGHNRPKSNPNPQLPETNTTNPTPNTTTNTNNTNITNPSNNNNNNNNAVSISPVKVSPLHPVILPSTTAGMSPKAKNIINPQNMFNNNNNNNNNNNENTNINNVNPTRLSINNNPGGPYLQTPQIIQQARQQAQASLNNNNQPPSPTNGSINGANNGNNMPSLDYYMKTGLTLPIGVTTNNNNNNNKPKPNNAVQPLASLPAPTSNNNGAVEIPKLQLKNARNVVVPPLQRPSINNNNNNNNEPLQSQTARLPVPNALMGQMNTNNINNINNINNNVAMAPVSARAVLETTQHNVIIPSEFSPSNNSAGDPFDEGKGRPSTRRSRMRSRNGNDEQQQAIHEPLPAEGLLEMEQIPIKHNTTILNANDGSSDSSKVNEVMKEVQKMGINNEHNTTSIKAPEAPRGSSSNGGRRGKNLVTQQATAAPTTTTSNNVPLQPTAPTAARPSNPNPNAVKAMRPSVMSSLPAGVPPDSTAFNENRSEANRNKVANQGTIRFH